MSYQTKVPESPATDRSKVASKLDASGWGLFFIWVAITLMFEIPLGVAFVGIGFITIAGQGARKHAALAVEWGWMAIGLCFLVAGVWELLAIEIALFPIILLVVGVVVLLGAIRGKV